jgi:hypothetical protein
VVALNGLHPVAPGISTVAVHLESDVLRDGTLAQSAYSQLPELLQGPFRRRRAKEPFPNLRRLGHYCIGGGKNIKIKERSDFRGTRVVDVFGFGGLLRSRDRLEVLNEGHGRKKRTALSEENSLAILVKC